MISIDWMLLVVAVMVMLFCIAAFIRITSDSTRPSPNSGLLSLSEADHLVAFQDFNHDVDGWTPTPAPPPSGVQGPVLGPFSDEHVERRFQLPIDTDHVLVRFDLQLHGPWAAGDALAISLSGHEPVALVPSGQADGAITWAIAGQDETGLAATVHQRGVAPPVGGSDQPVISLTITLQVPSPTEDLLLGFDADPPEGASWSLDNLAVVATTDGEA
ncbi:hypothetical protein HKCCE4037_03465 [Rhodobacterales bacterium HKCCE4037]|nr:hypothetical protein [Rhodobacterales bacterium HKCCE4037]